MKAYIYRGKRIFVSVLESGGYGTVWLDKVGRPHRIAISPLPVRKSREVAEVDLDVFASVRKLKEAE